MNVTALHSEVCKNLVLAGIGSLTILDNHDLRPDDDISSNFLLSVDDVGMNVR